MNKTTLLRSGLVLSLLGGAALVSSLPVSAQTTPYNTPSPTAAKTTDDDAAEFARLDKNKDGKLSPDEYGADPVLNSIGRYEGNRDGIVTEDEWDVFARKVLGPNCLIALRIENGRARELWRYDKNFNYVVPSTLAYQDVLYILRNGGILTTHDAATGKVIKAARIEGALGGYSSSPVAAEGKVWLASEEGKVSVLRAGGEWEVLAVNDLGEGCYATPALAEGVILGRHLLHARNRRGAAFPGLGRPHVGHRLQVVQRDRVGAGMRLIGPVVRRLRHDALGEGARQRNAEQQAVRSRQGARPSASRCL